MGLRTALGLKPSRVDYDADGMRLVGKNLSALDAPDFGSAWKHASDGFMRATGKPVSDIRLRALTAVWAARQALLTEGNFVECGVATGVLATVVCHMLDFGKLPRRYFLFDTFRGIPLDALSGMERAFAKSHNDKYYSDVYESTKQSFAKFPNVALVRGNLPDTLSEIPESPISYISMDLNSKTYEMQVIERLWPRLSVGGVVLLDDYGFNGHEDQFDAWNDFAESVGHPILQLPSGQGLMVKAVA